MEQKIITAKNFSAFKNYLIEDEKSKATVEKYLRDVHHFWDFAGNSPLEKATILSYKSYLNREYSVKSANSMLAALNSFMRFLGWYELCVKQFKLQREVYAPEERELSKKEYEALVATAKVSKNLRLALVIQTICATGIRVSELMYITVESVKKAEATVTCKGKTRKIFIVKALRTKLLDYISKNKIISGPVFITKGGKPLNRSNIWREMKQLCHMAGVSPQKVFPHNLRHLFARTFYGIERDIAKLADILGHSNINTTRIYVMTTCAEHKMRMEMMRLII